MIFCPKSYPFFLAFVFNICFCQFMKNQLAIWPLSKIYFLTIVSLHYCHFSLKMSKYGKKGFSIFIIIYILVPSFICDFRRMSLHFFYLYKLKVWFLHYIRCLPSRVNPKVFLVISNKGRIASIQTSKTYLVWSYFISLGCWNVVVLVVK